MDESTGFHVDILFPDEYEDFIAEIYFNKSIVCILSQDTGHESIDIEFPSESRAYSKDAVMNTASS